VLWALPVLGVLYLLSLVAILVSPGALQRDWVSAADVSARYFLLLPGQLLAALGLWSEFRDSLRLGLPRIGYNALGASVSFGQKLITSGLAAFPVFGSPQSLPPPAVIGLFASRTLGSVAIAFFVARYLRALEIERNRQFDLAVEEQLLARQDTLAAQQRMYTEMQRWARQFEHVVDSIASASSRAAQLDDILDMALDQVLELTEYDVGKILLMRPEQSTPELISRRGPALGAPDCTTCLELGMETLKAIQPSRESVLVWNLLEDQHFTCRPCLEAGFRSLVSVLLTCGGNLLGTMNLLSKSETLPQAPTLRMLSVIGRQIGLAVEHARLYEQGRNIATLEERVRLGRELHDGLAQVLGYLHLKIHSAADLLSSDDVAASRADLSEMHEVTQQALRDVRGSILGLRTTISPDGIIPALSEYVRRFSQQSGIETQLVTGNAAEIEFGPTAEIQLLRIVQEALANTRKHAWASRAWVRFEANGELATITIEDDGRGFDPERAGQEGHYGVHTMRERAESVGGELQITTGAGQGTKVLVRLPYRRQRGE
jgi:signal transduction histidine kinase